MVSKKWFQKVVSGNGLKNNLKNWFQKMVSKNGFKKWFQNMVSKNGLAQVAILSQINCICRRLLCCVLLRHKRSSAPLGLERKSLARCCVHSSAKRDSLLGDEALGQLNEMPRFFCPPGECLLQHKSQDEPFRHSSLLGTSPCR